MKAYYRHPFQNWEVIQTPTLWQAYQNYNYMLAKDGKAYVFDPGELAPIAKTLKSLELKLEAIYLTHHHADHVGAVLELKEQWQCPVYGFVNDQSRLPGLTQVFQENQMLTIGDLTCQILFVPGHTLGLCAFYFPKMKWLLSSDLIFSLGCGRIFEGSPQQMFASLSKIRNLPDDTLIFSSHEYTNTNLNFGLKEFPTDIHLLGIKAELQEKISKSIPTVPMTLEFEKRNSPFLRWDDPSIRQSLTMENATDWEVFAEIRRRRNSF